MPYYKVEVPNTYFLIVRGKDSADVCDWVREEMSNEDFLDCFIEPSSVECAENQIKSGFHVYDTTKPMNEERKRNMNESFYFKVALKNGGYYIFRGTNLWGAKEWARKNFGCDLASVKTATENEVANYGVRGRYIFHSDDEVLDSDKPHVGTKRAYTVSGKAISSLEDLPAGHVSVYVSDVYSVLDFPETPIINGSNYSRKAVLAMIKGMAAVQKISAVKLVRSFTNWGLKEAKDFVESL